MSEEEFEQVEPLSLVAIQRYNMQEGAEALDLVRNTQENFHQYTSARSRQEHNPFQIPQGNVQEDILELSCQEHLSRILDIEKKRFADMATRYEERILELDLIIHKQKEEIQQLKADAIARTTLENQAVNNVPPVMPLLPPVYGVPNYCSQGSFPGFPQLSPNFQQAYYIPFLNQNVQIVQLNAVAENIVQEKVKKNTNAMTDVKVNDNQKRDIREIIIDDDDTNEYTEEVKAIEENRGEKNNTTGTRNHEDHNGIGKNSAEINSDGNNSFGVNESEKSGSKVYPQKQKGTVMNRKRRNGFEGNREVKNGTNDLVINRDQKKQRWRPY